MKQSSQFVVSLIGAREHYGLPVSLHKQGLLRAFLCDFWLGPIARRIAVPLGLKRLAGRYHEGLRDARIDSCAGIGLWHRFRSKLRRTDRYESYVSFGMAFDKWAARLLPAMLLSDSRVLFLGYTSASLQCLRLCRELGAVGILNQIDPHSTEWEIVERERARWPGWDLDRKTPSPRYRERVFAEWRDASLIVVNSEWTRRALVSQGVLADKIVIVPLAYESSHPSIVHRYDGQRPLRLLWLGSVILRKGIPYLLEISDRLGKSIDVRIVGDIGIARGRVERTPPNVRFYGRVPRSEAETHYRWADVFVLPTLSDGFGITQLEAMAYGLPVITTPCCGDVVTDGIDGFVVPQGDPDQLEGAVAAFLRNPQLIEEMSSMTSKKLHQFSYESSINILTTAASNLFHDE